MFYEFPEIIHINDVLPYIKDVPEFIVSEKEHFTVISYVLAGVETFPTDTTDRASIIRRECRGLTFSKDGYLISRRYHKFFNVNERPDVSLDQIDWTQPHVILEKLDGSMVTPLPIGDDIRWGTKMGITDTSMQAEVFVASHPEYTKFAKWCIGQKITPIFEWCSNKNRIILSYPEDQLILTGMRHLLSGDYVPYKTMREIAQILHIPVVKAFEVEFDQVGDHILDTISKWQDAEGIVIRFNNGHMFKVKSEWYVLRHRSKDMITREYVVIDMLVNSEADDVSSFLSPEDRQKMAEFSDKFWANLNENARLVANFVQDGMSATDFDRKRFALEIVPTAVKAYHPVLWQIYDGVDAITAMKKQIQKNCKASRIDSVRELFSAPPSVDKPLRWEYNWTFKDESDTA